MKEKIGLITFYQNNYGSILQCFSTKSLLRTLNYDCDVLCLSEYQRNDIIIRLCKFVRLVGKILRYPSFCISLAKSKLYGNCLTTKLTTRTIEEMNSFVKSYLKPVEISNKVLKKDGEKRYNLFIAGSDQIWNLSSLFYSFYFLTFAPREKRISFAVSFGISQIPKYNQKELQKVLNEYNYISVREETGVEIVKKYSNTKVCRIADPTFIYNADEWRDFAKDAVIPSQKYILVHFLNEPNEIALESMAWLSKQLNLDVIALGYKYDVFDKLKRFTFMDGGPWEYVSMIDHAEFVLTDSFHSSLFSINFNKRFFVFHRDYSVSKQTSRISDLLKRFGMDNRLIENVDILKNIYLEYLPEETSVVLKKERATIRDYIQKSISGQIPQCFLQGENDAT
ncbi:Polysaccharide pyruvyl transferase [Fibrobacter sp. UWB15]|uniref:polysaccharide pyruvyl transferase family protein n=1 Tax=unclassified Fibrobacter TaxID=2634177 RepID=UPI000913906A|nr:MULTISPECIES: polysaccharide pyruvyl transferase family protein [unclassified Fibrobacter]PWJ65605.1 polysaccharide pyruvyl transferase [Fibrobacter sp. UWB6]SHF98024.1 Polysaccharide pyruvyl transferase [Fibrobacter sp. UWB8]SMG23735.1 Polysaccharide pyruvyl transferase [Fibrobacter sp. UWB15]